VKANLARLFIGARLYRAAAPFTGLRGSFVVLMYHRILPVRDPLQPSVSFEDFASDMDFISRNFTPVSLSSLTGSLPKRAVAITIDDGYREIYDFVYPLIKERGVPVTAFIVSDFAGTDRVLWTTELAEMVGTADSHSVELETMDGEMFTLGSIEERRACIDSIKRFIKPAPPRVGDSVMDEVRAKLGRRSGGKRAMLSWEEIGEMSGSCMEFGSHTRSHAIVSRVDRKRAWNEIAGSKEVMESRLGRNVASFCYPNGQEGDFDDETIAMVRKAGYSLAVTSIPGANTSAADRYALRRSWTEGCSRENLYTRIYREFLFPRRE